MKRGTPVVFTTKYGDRATGLYLSKKGGAHLVVSDDCFGPDHADKLNVMCFLFEEPATLEGEEAEKVKERIGEV